MHPALRLLTRAVAVVALLGFTVWLGCLLAVVLVARRDDATTMPGPAEAIIVLGAAQYGGRPSPVLRARLDHAVALWQRGLAPRLIVTGGRGGQRDFTTEAAVGRSYARSRGVPDSVILLESEGRTTDQSLRAAAAIVHELARQRGARGPEIAILVSDPFHMLRLSVVARRYDIVPYTSPTPTSPISSNAALSFRYMLGESLKVPFVRFMERSDD